MDGMELLAFTVTIHDGRLRCYQECETLLSKARWIGEELSQYLTMDERQELAQIRADIVIFLDAIPRRGDDSMTDLIESGVTPCE